MRLVEVIPSLKNKGGAETFFVELCEELSTKKNVELFVIILYNDEINNYYMKILKKSGIKIYKCNKHKGVDFKAYKVYRTLLRKMNPNIIHMHLSCLVTHFFAFGIRKRSWKIFHTCHTTADNDVNFVNFIVKKLFLIKKNIIEIAISDIVGKTLFEKYKINFPVVYNGVKIRDYSQKNDKLYDFIIVARFVDVKNHNLLIRAFKKIVMINPDLTLICCGDGPTLEESKILVHDLSIDKNVIFLGNVNDPANYLNKSRYFVLSSNYEGNPISILEAMSHGLPIVAPNIGGIPDIVVNRINGLLFETRNLDSLVESLTEIQKLNYIEVSENNIKKVANYSMAICAENYLRLFKDYEQNFINRK